MHLLLYLSLSLFALGMSSVDGAVARSLAKRQTSPSPTVSFCTEFNGQNCTTPLALDGLFGQCLPQEVAFVKSAILTGDDEAALCLWNTGSDCDIESLQSVSPTTVDFSSPIFEDNVHSFMCIST